MSSLFSSPSKQASSAASAEGDINTNLIKNQEAYDQTQDAQLRGAIAGQGANPYFTAAAQMSPKSMQVNPTDTNVISSSGPGTQTAGTTTGIGTIPKNAFANTGQVGTQQSGVAPRAVALPVARSAAAP